MDYVHLTREQLNTWVRDLRSGEFEQGKGALCAEKDGKTTYCCLGVLGKQLDLFISKIKLDDDGGREVWTISAVDYEYLPPHLVPLAVQSDLADMNDSGHNDFIDIAEYIEENLSPIEDQ